jgi:hypothetical protein
VEVEEIVVGEPGSVGGNSGCGGSRGPASAIATPPVVNSWAMRSSAGLAMMSAQSGHWNRYSLPSDDQAVGGAYDVQDDIIGSQIDLAT